mmetsp:Transcript_45357/g.102117  ORF Transcript_45357/g.102117 Transcript_45357/m.102117 type:complete len:224 (+) Transcript_45357:3-674(+)
MRKVRSWLKPFWAPGKSGPSSSSALPPPPALTMPTGFLKKWLGEKGFGFVTPDDQTTGDLLAHIRQKCGPAEEAIQEGRRVQFDFEMDVNRGKPRVTSWSFLEGMVAVPNSSNNWYGQGGQAQGGQLALPAPGGGPPPPPPPPAPIKHTQEEVEVPMQYLTEIIGQAGMALEEIKMRAGGDISIELSPADASMLTRTVKIRGPAVSASIGACLMLQRVAEVVV